MHDSGDETVAVSSGICSGAPETGVCLCAEHMQCYTAGMAHWLQHEGTKPRDCCATLNQEKRETRKVTNTSLQ